MSASRALLVAPLLLVAAIGCKPKGRALAPERARHTQANSAVSSDADLLVAALRDGDLQLVRQWMTPELRSRLSADDLAQAGDRLRREFGAVQGVLEESTHRESDLLWYSGLWIHRVPGRRETLTPVLYQFALDRQHRLARLLVREHWFLETITPPADAYLPVTRLHFPGRGEWFISHGGRSKGQNHHFGSRTQRFAYDIVMKKNGRRKRPGADSKANASYYCYGQPLLAPAAGTVVVAIDGVPENVIGQSGRKGGNGLVIDHGFGEFTSMWHAIPGSLTVGVGDRVEVGQQVARTGNSGRSSGPHLHFDMQTRGLPRGDFGLPAPFVEVFVAGSFRESVEPGRGDFVRGDPPPGVLRRSSAAGPRIIVNL